MPQRTYQPSPLSAAALDAIERVAQGRARARGASPKHLAEAVTALSVLYTRERARLGELAHGDDALLARLGFFFARDLPKVFGPLDELVSAGLFRAPPTLRVLDAGAGLGATSLGIARWLRLRGQAVERLEVTALERSKSALRCFEALAQAFAQLPDEFVPLALSVSAADLRQARVTTRFDLIAFGFVLNELFPEASEEERTARTAELVLDAAGELREGGAIVVLEPALK